MLKQIMNNKSNSIENEDLIYNKKYFIIYLYIQVK